MRILVTGATGLIGRALAAELVAEGHEVLGLSRAAQPVLPPRVALLRGDPAAPGPWREALRSCDACVNLAGEPVDAGRWNPERKWLIRESRVRSAALVAEAVAAGGPRVLVQASAVGFYGERGDEELTERSVGGDGFLAETCRDWEAAAAPATARARLVLLRTGIVLARQGGALPRLALPFRLLAGGPIGAGAFWQPWVHLADVVGLVRWALGAEKVAGPLNATAPVPLRNRDLARALGAALHRPSLLPVPRLAARLALGEMARAVTQSQRVVPRKAIDLGYPFRFPEIPAALSDLLR